MNSYFLVALLATLATATPLEPSSVSEGGWDERDYTKVCWTDPNLIDAAVSPKCKEGYEKKGLFCYPLCKEGYKSKLLECVPAEGSFYFNSKGGSCKPGFHPTVFGTVCANDKSHYTRAFDFTQATVCPYSFYLHDGHCFCYRLFGTENS